MNVPSYYLFPEAFNKADETFTDKIKQYCDEYLEEEALLASCQTAHERSLTYTLIAYHWLDVFSDHPRVDADFPRLLNYFLERQPCRQDHFNRLQKRILDGFQFWLGGDD